MKMTGRQRIEAAPQKVWDALNDPEILKACIPGCQSLEAEGDDRMRAVVAIKVGPISARFAGAVALTEQDPPRSCLITGEGQGGNAGVAKGQARVNLEDDGGATVLSYDVDAQVGGKLAQVGGALIDATAKRLAGSFFQRFGELVAEPQKVAEPGAKVAPPAAAEASPQPAPGRAPPVAPSVSRQPTATSWGGPVVWMLAVALAALVGFLAGRGQGGAAASDWMGIAIGLLLVLVAAAAFAMGRGSAAPMVMLDAEQLARLLRERDR
jgi:carbon monoxide dehydrogenase subunit G